MSASGGRSRQRAAPADLPADGSETSAAALVVTCEHGGNCIPAQWRELFEGDRALLDSHRGYDAGALTMAHELAAAFDAPLLTADVSRLVVDLNRSVGHPRLHGEHIRALPRETRQRIVELHYLPWRARAEALVHAAVVRVGRVIHLSAHSFTPVLDGKVRRADVGLLYDPARPGELAFSRSWQAALRQRAPELVVRRNHPYSGSGDGLTRTLRRQWPPEVYVGIELELNQAFAAGPAGAWATAREQIIEALRNTGAVS